MKSIRQSILSSIVILLIFQVGTIIGQMPEHKVVQPSPEAAQLGIFGTVPVGLFTGTIQQSIPLYEFKTANLSLPISLNYSSNGLLVDRIASWVGYEWLLDAGGVITLSVKGRHDNNTNRPYLNPDELSDLHNFLFTHRTAEFQPDEYHFNFAGYTGRFFIDSSGLKVYTIPFQKLKIETSRSDGNLLYGTDFIITTPDGVKYAFTVKEYTTVNEIYFGSTLISYPTAWYLTSITHPTGDQINLYYAEPQVARFYSGIRQQIFRVFATQNFCSNYPPNPCPIEEPNAVANGTYTHIAYLDSIKSANYGTIVFNKSNEVRLDLKDGKRLESIVIKNNLNQVIKTIDFVGHYVKSFGFAPGGMGATINWREDGYKEELDYRLFLDAVEINDMNSNKVQKYSFYYNSLGYLPSRLSFAQDHWGYFNGKHNAFLVPQGYLHSSYLGLFPETFADRTPNVQYSQYGMLNKIVYPTGGYSTIEYQSHHDGTSPIGGCRVRKISTYDNFSSVPQIKVYSYSPGTTQGLPTYFRSYYSYFPCYNSKGEVIDAGSCQYVGLTSSSIYSHYINNQYHIGYAFVDISHGENFENGGESHSFEIVSDNPGYIVNTMGGMPFPLPYSNQGWYTGTKKSETYFKVDVNGTRKNVKNISYDYNRSDNRNRKNMLCLSIIDRVDEDPRPSVETETSQLRYFDVAGYYLYSVWQQLSSKTETEYDDTGNPMSTVTTYYYDNDTHAQLSRESTTNSKGEIVLKKYYYPHDYTTSSYNIGNLRSKFILNKPIDVRTYTAGKISSLEQYKYNTYGQTTDYYKADITPWTTDIAFAAGTPYTASRKMIMIYNDTDKKLITTKPENDIPTSYIWGYKGQYPVAKIVGGDYTRAYDVLTTAEKNTLNGSPTDEQVRTIIKKIRDYYKNNFGVLVYTYTYKPLYGITSETDPNGITVTYEYDNFGRLKVVKNADEEILKTYDYHYKE